jgi:hypothetical protein
LLGVVSLAGTPSVFADAETIRFSGDESSKPPAFTVDGPWLLDWSTRSEFPLLANFELRLHDGLSGKFIGTITQLEGTGRGLKLFEDAGTYHPGKCYDVCVKVVLWSGGRLTMKRYSCSVMMDLAGAYRFRRNVPA